MFISGRGDGFVTLEHLFLNYVQLHEQMWEQINTTRFWWKPD